MVIMHGTGENNNKLRFYMGLERISNLEIIKEAIANKWDSVVIIFGKEGTGKSTYGSQECYYLDKKFNIDKTVYSAKQFFKAISSLPPGSSILWDEAISGAQASQHANVLSKTIITKFTIIREKGYKIYVVFPYLHMLNKYFVSRCSYSIFVYAKGFTKRGYYKFYSAPRTELVYNMMKSKYQYTPMQVVQKNIIKPNFSSTFSDCLCLDNDLYKKKKRKASESFTLSEDSLYKTLFAEICYYLKINKVLKYTQMGDVVGLKASEISYMVNNFKKDQM